MDRDCPEFEGNREKFDTWFTEKERRTWEAHLARCPACRNQWAAEEALDGLFSEAAPPGLSEQFNQNLRQRIAAEPKTRHRWLILVMQVYWLAASLVSAVILFKMEGIKAEEGVMVGMFLLLCFTGPILLLGFRLRFGLFDLIFSTMAPLERPAEPYRNGFPS